jgi:hypothetical protein
MRDTALMRRMMEVDVKGTAQLRGIVDRFGWPTRSMVGAKGADAAYLVAQHTDDLPFRERVLALMLAASPGEVSASDLATLQDRTLVRQGKKQIYGTQFSMVGDVMKMDPVEDEAGLEARRAAKGLMPLADYMRFMGQMYKARVVRDEQI